MRQATRQAARRVLDAHSALQHPGSGKGRLHSSRAASGTSVLWFRRQCPAGSARLAATAPPPLASAQRRVMDSFPRPSDLSALTLGSVPVRLPWVGQPAYHTALSTVGMLGNVGGERRGMGGRGRNSDGQEEEELGAALVPRQRSRGKHKPQLQHQDEENLRSNYVPSLFPSGMRTNAQSLTAYCTSESYDFDLLLKALQKERNPAVYFAEVIHIAIPKTQSPASPSTDSSNVSDEGDVFFFKDGCVVFWDVPQEDMTAVMDWLAPYEIGAYDRQETIDEYSEIAYFRYGHQAGLMPSGELVISIGNQNWARTQILEKIAFSYGVQRSVKVSVMEGVADSLITSLKHIPDILTEKRALHMDQRSVMKVMGRLLALRALINLHLPLGETPEAYWEEPWLEELYHKMSRELDLTARIRTLNRKLDYAHQVVEVLRTDISEKHHTRLEMIIIGLIAIEVVFGFVHFFI
mmetsp:Transcript_3071/g.7410  ORF Transcript_3071/g.7410 Transcript_3071/m.7410 type:complete len:465 (-) Transcript_3071:167-1561(-)